MERRPAVLSSASDEDDPKLSSFVRKKICRCCLSTERRMKNAIDVQEYFMELAGINVTVSDGMPPWVCVECSALMKKGITFKYKMLRAQSVLYDYLMKNTPGQLNPADPELARFKAPHLSATNILTFDSIEEKNGFHSVLQQEKQLSKTELYDIPLLPMFENPSAALESVEAAFSDFEDDPLERFENTSLKKDNKEDNTHENDIVDEEEEEEEEEDDDEDIDDDDIDDDEELDDEDIDEDELEDMKCNTEDVSGDEETSEPEVKKVKKNKGLQSIKLENMSASESFSQFAPDLSWTSENDEILIDFVKRNEALYNPKSKVYKIGVLKKKLWIDIGAILNKSDTECCKRWNYVRDYYIRRRGKRAAGGEAARRRAALLAFLDDVPSAQRAWAPPRDSLPEEERDRVKEEGAFSNFEHLWEQIRIGDQFSKMSSVAWTSAKEELLIDFVRRNEALYNPRSKDFRKPQVKQKLWCDIGAMLNKSDTDCSKRWGYVRDYYTRRKANPGALSTGKAAKRRAELLSFLDYVPPPQRPMPSHEDEILKSELLEASAEKARAQASYSEDYAAHSSDYRMETQYSKMSSNATWTNENDEILIDFVRRNESLFNPKSKHFRKALMKQRLWRNIGSMLNKSDSDCYKRWCYVRDYYIRRRGKAGILSTGKAAKRRAELLSFLDNVPSAAKSAPLSSQAANQDKSSCRVASEPCDSIDDVQDTLTDYVGQHLDEFREQYVKMSRDVTWTWENDEKLIEFVRRHDTLYNPKSRNSQLKQKLWREIGKKLNKKDSDCCKRWCYVRDYYRRRSKFAPCGESARRRATLLAFLDNVPTIPRNSTAAGSGD